MCYICVCWKLGDDIEKGLQYKAKKIVTVYKACTIQEKLWISIF